MKTLKQKYKIMILTSLIALAVPMQTIYGHEHAAEHDHGDDHHHDTNHSHDDGHQHEYASPTMLSNQTRSIDGYTVTFHVLKAVSGMEMGGSHHFMVKVEKDGKAVTDLKMNTKVKYPDGKAETKAAMKMDDWFMTGYDLGHEGKHQLMILFKTADGKKHKGGVYFPDH